MKLTKAKTIKNSFFVIFPALSVCVVFADSSAVFDRYKVYFGNLHAHTSFSDGSGTPEEAYRHAKQKGKLDFMAITEHNHTDNINPKDPKGGKIIGEDSARYDDLIQTANAQNAQSAFIAFYGQEFSSISKGNHLNVFGVKEVIDEDDVPNGNYKDLYETWLPGHPEVQFIQFNHPWDGDSARDYGLRNYNGSYSKLVAGVSKYLRTFEVINGPGLLSGIHKAKVKGEMRFRHYLTHGFKVAPVADQDNHQRTWGTLTKARTGILAEELTAEDLLEGIAKRRCFASTDKDLKAWFSVNGNVMGTETTAESRLLKIEYKLEDPDEKTASYALTLVYGSPEISGSSREHKFDSFKGDHDGDGELTTEFQSTFVYLKVTQWPNTASKKDFLLTSPVWIDVP